MAAPSAGGFHRPSLHHRPLHLRSLRRQAAWLRLGPQMFETAVLSVAAVGNLRHGRGPLSPLQFETAVLSVAAVGDVWDTAVGA